MRAKISTRRSVALALTIVCSITVCGIVPARAERLGQEGAQGSATAPTAATDGKAVDSKATKFVTDETGRHMSVPLNVRRIVSLAPNLTETIYALGQQNKLAGDTTYCDIPAAAKEKPHVGSPVNPSLEAVVALHPDLVLATTSINRAQTADALLKLGIPVYTSDPHTVNGILSSIEVMAELMGASEQGATLVAALQERLEMLHARLQDRPMVHVLFVVWDEPLISIGQNTFISDALRWAGAESIITSSQNWPQVSLEEVVRLQPDYIVIAGDHAQAEAPGSKGATILRARPTWRDLQAVKQGRIVIASDEVSRPSPGLVDAIEEIARDLHPEAFSARLENGKTKSELAAYLSASPTMMREYAECVR
ncbi:MAG: ABC transporter substrate-binding protein [Candidatus Acidiferrales bacterium]